jgi:hypothetical protein
MDFTIGCAICLKEVPTNDVEFLQPCDHAFCRHCVMSMADAAVDAGSLGVICPHDGCGRSVAVQTIQHLLQPRTAALLERQELASALIGSTIAQCRTVNCPNFVVFDGEPAEFSCTECGHIRCVLCGAEPFHVAQPCPASRSRTLSETAGAHIAAQAAPKEVGSPAVLQASMLACDAPTRAYIESNTRVCRRCASAVEKASGVSWNGGLRLQKRFVWV